MKSMMPRFLIVPGLCLALGLTVGYVVGAWRGVRLAERRAAYPAISEAEATALYGRRVDVERASGVNSVPAIRKQMPTPP